MTVFLLYRPSPHLSLQFELQYDSNFLFFRPNSAEQPFRYKSRNGSRCSPDNNAQCLPQCPPNTSASRFPTFSTKNNALRNKDRILPERPRRLGGSMASSISRVALKVAPAPLRQTRPAWRISDVHIRLARRTSVIRATPHFQLLPT